MILLVRWHDRSLVGGGENIKGSFREDVGVVSILGWEDDIIFWVAIASSVDRVVFQMCSSSNKIVFFTQSM